KNAVDLWQSPYQHGAMVEGQVKFLCSLSDQNEYLGLINVLHLTQVKTDCVEDMLPGGLDWKYDNFHLPPRGHRWSVKHESGFSANIFIMAGEVHGRVHLVAQALLAGMLICDAKMVAGG
ncbi:hypothetical protein PAXRUDRAFT_796548, partial [Paxillus rubicundulus Ve08.2h10]